MTAWFLLFASLSLGLSIAAPLERATLLRSGRSRVSGSSTLSATLPAAENATLGHNEEPTGHCSLMGGLVSPNVSASCCFSVQVATQRGLSKYGMAEPCKAAWRCQADGVTPEEGFEEQALNEVCSEPSCLAGVTAAMKGNWKTVKAAEYMETLCNFDVVSVANGTKDGLIRASAEGMERPARRGRRANRTESANRTKSACFPGEALVQVRGRGAVPIASLHPGEWVLAAKPAVGAPLVYEPVLDWIHVVRGGEASVTIIHHEHGILRASPGHIVFATTASSNGDPTDVPAGLLQKGDVIFAMLTANLTDGNLIPSRVLSIEDGFVSSGMYAPLTNTGTILVDGVLASNYATPSLEVRLPHWLAHAGLLPVRIFHSLGLHGLFATARAALLGDYGLEGIEPEVADIMHPYFSFLYHGLHAAKLLQST